MTHGQNKPLAARRPGPDFWIMKRFKIGFLKLDK